MRLGVPPGRYRAVDGDARIVVIIRAVALVTEGSGAVDRRLKVTQVHASVARRRGGFVIDALEGITRLLAPGRMVQDRWAQRQVHEFSHEAIFVAASIPGSAMARAIRPGRRARGCHQTRDPPPGQRHSGARHSGARRRLDKWALTGGQGPSAESPQKRARKGKQGSVRVATTIS